MKNTTKIIITLSVISFLITCYTAYKVLKGKKSPLNNLPNFTDDDYNDIAVEIASSGLDVSINPYNPPGTPIATVVAHTRPVATVVPVIAKPVSYSPFNKAAYLDNQNNGNLLPQSNVDSFISTLRNKLQGYTKYLAAFWNVDKTISDLGTQFKYQVQVSQIANAYYNAYGTEMLTDITNTMSDSDNGKKFINAITYITNSLPKGY